MTAAIAVGNGDSRPVERTCQCFGGGRRRPPLRIHEDTARQVRREMPNLRQYAHLVIADYRCPSCKKLVDLTVGDVFGR